MSDGHNRTPNKIIFDYLDIPNISIFVVVKLQMSWDIAPIVLSLEWNVWITVYQMIECPGSCNIIVDDQTVMNLTQEYY